MADRNVFQSFSGDQCGGEDDNMIQRSEDEQSVSDEEEFRPVESDIEFSSSDSDESDSASVSATANTSLVIHEEVRDSTVIRSVIYKAKDGTEWKSVPAERHRTNESNLCTLPRNRLPNTQNAKTPIEVFQLFTSADMINLIVRCTNEEGQRQKGERWRKTDKIEIEALLGIYLFLGAQKQSKVNIKTIWTPLIGQDFVRACMSKNRYFELSDALRFDSKDTRLSRLTRDKLAHFREILEMQMNNLKTYYIPGPFLTVDEQLIPFRGRCSFIQYMPSKPAKYGIKLFWVCDAETFFPLLCIPYTGKTSGIDRDNGLTQGSSVVLQLCSHWLNKGRNITTDNFFTDKALSEMLLAKKTTIIGTVRRNKRFLPQDFQNKKKLKLHDSLFGFAGDHTLVSYQGHRNKNVVLLSTMHDKPDTHGENRKPQIVLDYNKTKSGVDTMDQMCLTYTSKRATKRWPLVLLFNLLDTNALASHIVFKTKFPENELSKEKGRADFIRALSKDLMRFNMMRRYETLIKASRPLRDLMMRCLDDMGISVMEGPAASDRGASTSSQTGAQKRGRCGMCNWKENKKGTAQCLECKKFLCKDHINVFCGKHIPSTTD